MFSIVFTQVGNSEARQPDGKTAFGWAMLLVVIPAGIALALAFSGKLPERLNICRRLRTRISQLFNPERNRGNPVPMTMTHGLRD